MMSPLAVRRFSGTSGEWDAFVASTNAANFSHQYDWLQLCRDVYGGEPHYLVAYRNDRLVGVLPAMLRRIVGGRVLTSVPLADEGGIVADDPEAEQAIIVRATQLLQECRASHLELRQRIAVPGTEVDRTRVTLEMPLPEAVDELWGSFKAKVRNQVRKAEKCGLQAHVADDIEAAISDAFYPVYCENTRDLGSPMHSERFFHEVAGRFPDASRVVVVTHEGTTVGGAFAVIWRDRFLVPWAASLRRYFSMCPNNLLYWELMRLAIADGCNVFDFGRSPHDSGTYKFKQQWGAEPVQLYYCYYSHSGSLKLGEKRDSAAYRVFSALWKRTPLPIARTIGPKIFARLPI